MPAPAPLVPRTVWWLMAVGMVLAAIVAARGRSRLPAITEPAAPSAAIPDLGRRTYVHCQACHGIEGLGVPGLAPPLRGSPVLLGDPTAAARLVLHGSVSSARWPMPMPGFAPRLDDTDVAAVLTWLRSQWGHQAAAVTPGQVAAARPWTSP